MRSRRLIEIIGKALFTGAVFLAPVSLLISRSIYLDNQNINEAIKKQTAAEEKYNKLTEESEYLLEQLRDLEEEYHELSWRYLDLRRMYEPQE